MGTGENKCQISQNDNLHMKFSEFYLAWFHNSCEICYFSGSHVTEIVFYLVLLQITNYIYSPGRRLAKKTYFSPIPLLLIGFRLISIQQWLKTSFARKKGIFSDQYEKKLYCFWRIRKSHNTGCFFSFANLFRSFSLSFFPLLFLLYWWFCCPLYRPCFAWNCGSLTF